MISSATGRQTKRISTSILCATVFAEVGRCEPEGQPGVESLKNVVGQSQFSISTCKAPWQSQPTAESRSCGSFDPALGSWFTFGLSMAGKFQKESRPSSRSTPALWSRSFHPEARDPHQHDAYSIAAWPRRADREGSLGRFLSPCLNNEERKIADFEGWILGVP